MKKTWLDTVLAGTASSHATQTVDTETLFEQQKDVATSEEKRSTLHPPRLEGVVLGILVGFNETGVPLVNFPANPTGDPIPARSAVALGKDTVARDIALLFEDCDPCRPIVMGLIQHPEDTRPMPSESARREGQSPIEADVDGERIVFTAKKEIVLRCGKASITLTRAGKVLIRGAYLLSRSSGVNRIKGGSVQIN
jgi:hypothetical protein